MISFLCTVKSFGVEMARAVGTSRFAQECERFYASLKEADNRHMQVVSENYELFEKLKQSEECVQQSKLLLRGLLERFERLEDCVIFGSETRSLINNARRLLGLNEKPGVPGWTYNDLWSAKKK